MKKFIIALILNVFFLNVMMGAVKYSSEMYSSSDRFRQEELDLLVSEHNIGYREAKNIYYQKLRDDQTRVRRIKQLEAQQQKMKFYFNNPAFEFNEMVMQWHYEDWQL